MSAPTKTRDLAGALERRLESRAADSAFDTIADWRGTVEGVEFDFGDGDGPDEVILTGNDGSRYRVECEVMVTVRELPSALPERERQPVLTVRTFHAGADHMPPDDLWHLRDRDDAEWLRLPSDPSVWRSPGGTLASWNHVLRWSPLTEVENDEGVAA